MGYVATHCHNQGIVSDGIISIAPELQVSIDSSVVGIIVPAVELIELHGVPSGIAVCLHGKQQRCSSIAVGLGERKERWPRVPDDNIRRASRFHQGRRVLLWMTAK